MSGVRKPTKSFAEVRNPQALRREEILNHAMRELPQQEPPKLTTLSARYRVGRGGLYTVSLATIEQTLFSQLVAHARADHMVMAGSPQMREWEDHATDCHVYEMAVQARPIEPLATSSDVSTLKPPWR